MAATEICFLDQRSDDLNVDEFLSIDTSVIMSFLENSQGGGGGGGGGDGEMLRAMIQSLEPEIMSCASCSDKDGSLEEFRFSDQVECCSLSPQNHPDFEWMDMEMDYFNGRFTGNAVEFGGLEDYPQVCYGVAMEEDDYIGLWQ